uniref:Uncharacterized protein n=1 Tax=Loigolactobacillus rennini TaxID=238013 RepID=A0A1K2I7F7_9LACO|nr:hypothetical protein LREN565_1435 [Loigolactobacillus rennini]
MHKGSNDNQLSLAKLISDCQAQIQLIKQTLTDNNQYYSNISPMRQEKI